HDANRPALQIRGSSVRSPRMRRPRGRAWRAHAHCVSCHRQDGRGPGDALKPCSARRQMTAPVESSNTDSNGSGRTDGDEMQRMDRLRPFTPQRCVSVETAQPDDLRRTNTLSCGVSGICVVSRLPSERHASRARDLVRTMFACLAAATLIACGSGGADGLGAKSLDANSEHSPTVDAKGTPETKPMDDFGAAQANTPAAVSKSGFGGLVNSVDTIIGDMSLENDAKLDGIPDFAWATGPYPAAVMMGADPRGCKMHSWWLDRSTVNAAYKDCDLWTALVQWFIVYEGVGNAGHNVRVETRRPRSYYLSRSTGTWHLIGKHAGTSWFLAKKSDITHV